jgi:L-fuconolactonase
MPDVPIVDAHVHIYDPTRLDFPWMRDAPRLNRPHLPADFTRLTEDVEVERFVFVEVDAAPGRHLDEARWVSEEAGREPRLSGMVGSIPLERGRGAEADLAAFAELPLARGVRRLIQSHLDEPGWCLRDAFVEGVRLLPEYGLSFDICIHHPQMRDAIELVRRCPDVSFVLDHIGKPGIRAGLREPWWSEMRELAREPNVWCKISGVVTEADHAAWTEEEVAPYVAHAIECFGFGRVMFGGDWPVSELATTYARWVALVDRVTAGSSDDERRKLWRDTAVGFYRL